MTNLISHEAEQAIVGACLLKNDLWVLASRIVRPDQFGVRLHREVAQAMADCHGKGLAWDVVTLSDLAGREHLPYLGKCASGAPSTAAGRIEHYARIVADKAARRQLVAAGYGIEALANEAGTVAEAVNQARAMLDGIGVHSDDATDPDYYMGHWYDAMQARKARGGALQGLETGFHGISNRWEGLCAPDLIILAARPSMGKTALAVNIAENVAARGTPVLLFSMEMSASQIADRRVSALAGVGLKGLRRCDLDADGWGRVTAAAATVKERPFFIDDRAALPIDTLRMTAAAHKARHGLGLVVVDYLGLATSPGSESRIQEVRKVSSGLKQLAKELEIPVIALAQLNRKCEERSNKRPLLSDLRETGDIEQDADIVSFLYRHEYYEPENDAWRGVAEVITAKCRNGEPGTDYLGAQLDRSRFVNLEYQFSPPRQKRRDDRI